MSITFCRAQSLKKVSAFSISKQILPFDFAEQSQQTRGIGPILFLCWPAVFDVGPTLKQHWANASCLLGYLYIGLAGQWFWNIKRGQLISKVELWQDLPIPIKYGFTEVTLIAHTQYTHSAVGYCMDLGIMWSHFKISFCAHSQIIINKSE